jgi:hypothetical protein
MNNLATSMVTQSTLPPKNKKFPESEHIVKEFKESQIIIMILLEMPTLYQ